ncbi:MAG TPA: redoxin domain-containing protein [Bryobacteraceae bacterium]|nr:redoxin domain-containing protein [Bryobacteraceae bacterium]
MARTTSLLLPTLLSLIGPILAQGPNVGEKLPAFRLSNQHGEILTLEKIRGSKGAMIVFYRSADWCTFCKSQLIEMEQSREELRRQGLALAAISYDPVPVLKHFSDRKAIRYHLLSDEGSSFIRSLGLLNEEVPKTSEFYGIPHPVTYIVDQDGVILSRVLEKDFRRRSTVGSLVGRKAGEVQVPAKRVKVTQSASDTLIHGGQRFKLRLDLDIPVRSHVYAPGVVGYIPLDWRIAESPRYETNSLVYPPSRRLHLKAIGETVPIYERHISLEREIVPAEKQAAGDFKIEGSLRYQVCDDRQCYVPETLPLAWSLRYEPHDTTRAPAELRRRVGQ